MPLPVFIESLVKDKQVASIMPTRRSCVRKFLNDLDLPPNATVVEYGPGTGAFTKTMLSKLGHNARLLAFETNPLMVEHLKKEVQDSRLEVFQIGAQDTPEVLGRSKIEEIDLALSGIPLSFLDKSQRKLLFKNTASLLKPDGTFLIYQSAWTPFKSDSEIIFELSEHFSLSHREFFWFNIPPLVALFLNLKPTPHKTKGSSSNGNHSQS